MAAVIPAGVEEMLQSLPENSCIIEVPDADDPAARFSVFWIDSSLGQTIRAVIAGGEVEAFQHRWCDEYPGAEAAVILVHA